MEEYINIIWSFVKENFLFIAIPLLILFVILLKPVRSIIRYMGRNIVPAGLYITISYICAAFGYSVVVVNAYTVGTALLLGLPGISLILFLALIN